MRERHDARVADLSQTCVPTPRGDDTRADVDAGDRAVGATRGVGTRARVPSNRIRVDPMDRVVGNDT